MPRLINDVDWENIPDNKLGAAKILTEAVQFVKDHDKSNRPEDEFSGQEVSSLLLNTMQNWFKFLQESSKKSPDLDLCFLVTAMLCYGYTMMNELDKADRKRCKKIMKMATAAGVVKPVNFK